MKILHSFSKGRSVYKLKTIILRIILLICIIQSGFLAQNMLRDIITGSTGKEQIQHILDVHEKINLIPLREDRFPSLPSGVSTSEEHFEFFLVVMTMVKNKAIYLPEWIEFHLLQGFDRFIIYDHGSDDETLAILAPYLDLGVVEYIRWPDEVMKINRQPFGPRIWPNETRKNIFWEEKLRKECIHADQSGWRPHGGCQRAAVLDSIARYRHRTRWLTTFDVDEFMGPVNRNLTVRDNLVTLDKYDQVFAHGKSFGTNGFISDPLPRSSGIPFPLMSERFTHRLSLHDSRSESNVRVVTHSFTQKVFGHGSKVSESWIHHFVFDDYMEDTETPIREYGEDRDKEPPLFWMYHYRFLSMMGIYRKRVSNGNFDLKYERARESFFTEEYDPYMLEWVPIIKDRIQKRMRLGYWKTLPIGMSTDLSDKVTSSFKALTGDRHRKPRLCVAVTWYNASQSSLRRTIQSFVHHMRAVENQIPFEMHLHVGSTALNTLSKNVPLDSSSLLPLHFPELVLDVTRVHIHPKISRQEALWDAAEKACEWASYYLLLEDVWETRLDIGENYEFERAPVLTNVAFIQSSIELMESNQYIDEVWIGDVPSFPAYTNVQTQWTPFSVGNEVDTKSKTIKRPTHYRLQCPFELPQNSSQNLKQNFYRGLDLLAFTRPGASIKRKPKVNRMKWVDAVLNGNLPYEDTYGSYILGSQVKYAESLATNNHLKCSAHFCRSESLNDCDIDPDDLHQESVFGFMWRQRLIFDSEDGSKSVLFDRPV